MDAASATTDFEAMLANLASHGMRAVDVVTTTMEAEQAIIKIVTASLPNPASKAALPASSLSDAIATGLDIDSAAAILAAAAPRIDILARAHEKLSRSVRRSIALLRRMQAGWTGARAADTRAAMQKRQVKAGVEQRIRDQSDDEPAERLFTELDEHLDDPGLDEEIAAHSVEAVVQRICRDIGLAAKALHQVAGHPPAPGAPQCPAPPTRPRKPAHPPDSG